MVIDKFKDDEMRHMPDEDHVEKTDGVSKPSINQQLEQTKSFIQDIGNSFGNLQKD